MQQGGTGEEVVELFVGFGGEPVTGMAVDAVVFHQGGRVDSPTLTVQEIGSVFGEGTGKYLGSDHWRYHKTNVLTVQEVGDTTNRLKRKKKLVTPRLKY